MTPSQGESIFCVRRSTTSRSFFSRLKLAERRPLLQNDGPLFVADLKAKNRIVGSPVDSDVAEVHIEVSQSHAIGIHFIAKSHARFTVVAAGLIQTAAGHFVQRIAYSCWICRLQFGNLGQMPVSTEHHNSARVRLLQTAIDNWTQ